MGEAKKQRTVMFYKRTVNNVVRQKANEALHTVRFRQLVNTGGATGAGKARAGNIIT